MYHTRTAIPEEFDWICETGFREIGPRHVTLDILQSRASANSAIAQIIEKKEGVHSHLAGYTLLYPLKGRPTAQILDGSMYSASRITAQDICRSFSNAASIYVGMIYGEPSGRDRAAVLVSTREQIREAVRASTKVPYLFARPATDRGRYWMERTGFGPIWPDRADSIWFIHPKKVAQIFT